mmetsp:Transcript_40358/g.67635  ORF Transcript_40358/g.67635 Transcript_40358/m.67635 type:complete len:317 (-) Transcript_40358:1778-2728(-)
MTFTLNAAEDTNRTRAETALRNLPYNTDSNQAHVAPGDVIDVHNEDSYLRGHGTLEVNGQLIATVAGIVERVNKLVSVRPVKSRYTAECGDVIVGRVVEIAGKRWKVDVNSRQASSLQLSAVNLPGGLQRRRTNVDELNMRSFFEEGDLISAEVQQVMTDGMANLHTRNSKYGKLEGGMLVRVHPVLIKRQKQHFHHLESLGVDIIFGCNGLVWVGCHIDFNPDAPTAMNVDGSDTPAVRPAVGVVEGATRENICRLANVVRVLAELFLPIQKDVVMSLFQASKTMAVELKDILGSEFQARILEFEVERRTAELAA